MHGRVKVRTTEEQKEIAKQEKCKKAKAYRNAMQIVVEKRSSGTHDQEALDVTSNLLTGNPDIITLWNYRREIFLQRRDENDLESYQKLLEKDLNLTEQCLRVNPKSYGSWHHRIWILENLPNPDWEKELILCTKYLQLDERNFHCWDYRRIVTQKSNVPDLSEYKYTLEKIEKNFSNYSAWHLRSKLLPKIFPDAEKKFPIDELKHREELELVENAAFTDPNDQSAWFYQRWLLGLTEPKTSFVHIEAREEDIFIVTSRSVKMDGTKFGVTIGVEINGEPSNGIWCNKSNLVQSSVWSFKPESKIQSTDSISLVLEENGVEYHRQHLQPFSIVNSQPDFLPSFSKSLMETLTNQLSSCEQLLELEPDSKWTLLTSIFLMLSINCLKYQTQIKEGLDKLREYDPLRAGYYLDLRSKIISELAIMTHYQKSEKFILKEQNLTRLYHSQYLHDFEDIDLSCNHFTSEVLSRFHVFLNCKRLNLRGNRITNLRDFPILPKLEVLLLDDNLIEEMDWEVFKKFPRLDVISVNGNPIAGKEDSIDKLASRLSEVVS